MKRTEKQPSKHFLTLSGGGAEPLLNICKIVPQNSIIKGRFSAFTLSEVFSPCRKVKFSFGFTLAEVFSPCRKVNFSFGFTLAEVLITLGIIGVVAAITLPTLIQNSQRRELQVGLKKGYSTISQALDMYYAENGERITC